MMKMLQELMNFDADATDQDFSTVGEEIPRLTDRQKKMLLQIHMAPTAEMAFSGTTGSVENVQTRTSLRALRLILVDEDSSRAGLSDEGQTALVTNNLISDTGDVTDDGESLLDTNVSENWMRLIGRLIN